VFSKGSLIMKNIVLISLCSSIVMFAAASEGRINLGFMLDNPNDPSVQAALRQAMQDRAAAAKAAQGRPQYVGATWKAKPQPKKDGCILS
jgi:hypothetical protein